MAIVGERLPIRQPDLGPEVVAERFGGDHHRIQGRERTAVTMEAGRIALEGPYHHLGSYRSSVCHDSTRLDGRCGGLLGNDGTETLNGFA